MKGSVWRSLLSRIVLLALVTCVFLAVAGVSFDRFLRSSQASTIGAAERHLADVAADVARAYERQLPGGVSLLHVVRPAPPPPSQPAAHAREKKSRLQPPAPPPPPPGSPPAPPAPPADPLSLIMADALQNEQGIEGGFLAGDGPLVGYAFPTHEGPGLEKEMPLRERPTIDQLAHAAESSDAPKTYVYEGAHDVVLFHALPLREVVNGREQVTGALWLMERLPDLNRGRSRQLLVAAIIFGSAALISALLAWFIAVEIRGGVNSIVRHLASLEGDLSHRAGPADRPRLEEFARVMNGVDAMATSLQSRISSERNLEMELRHRERLSSLGQFAAGVAHELRNPLATIRLRTQMAQDASREEIVARSSKVILEETDRLDAMIGRLLYFARPITLNPHMVEVCELCASVVASWQDRSPEGVTLALECPAELVIFVDRRRLTQVLDNLMENAVQALRTGGGEVSIIVVRAERTLEIRVADTGTGFNPTALSHAFDPFFTTKETGTGLGLSIAFELVHALNGELRAENRTAGGAIVTITLPLDDVQGEVSA